MNIETTKAEMTKEPTPALRQRYDLYCDLRSMGVTDVIIRDLLELELIRRGVFEDLGPYRTINS